LTDPDESSLSGWLRTFTDYMEYYSGSIEAWTEKTSDSALVNDLGAYAQAAIDASLVAVLAPYPREFPFDPVLSAIIMRGIIVRIPTAAQEMEDPVARDQSIEVVRSAIRRGFFADSAVRESNSIVSLD